MSVSEGADGLVHQLLPDCLVGCLVSPRAGNQFPLSVELGGDSSRRDLSIEPSYLNIGQLVDDLCCGTSDSVKPYRPPGAGWKWDRLRRTGLRWLHA